jgi:hypothetical protein
MQRGPWVSAPSRTLGINRIIAMSDLYIHSTIFKYWYGNETETNMKMEANMETETETDSTRTWTWAQTWKWNWCTFAYYYTHSAVRIATDMSRRSSQWCLVLVAPLRYAKNDSKIYTTVGTALQTMSYQNWKDQCGVNGKATTRGMCSKWKLTCYIPNLVWGGADI